MIHKIAFVDFRNFKEKLYSFSTGVNVIVGENGAGKTNLLEGVFALSTGKSFKSKEDEEMIGYGQELARVKALVNSSQSLEMVVTRGTVGGNTGKAVTTFKKRLFVDGVPRRMLDFAGNFKTVLFGPWDMELITSSPTGRRRFLDTLLFQVDREYRRAFVSYDKGLRQRNKLLLRIREEGVSRSQLLFWNELLIKDGNYISTKRQEFIDFINLQNITLPEVTYEAIYDKSIISPARLAEYSDREVWAGMTLVGPHRDDFVINEKKIGEKTFRDLARYGSRGEQRMGILWLKLNELTYIKNTSGVAPTLLLDDIFSELDHKHRKIVIDHSKNQQTIITTADKHFIEEFDGIEKINI